MGTSVRYGKSFTKLKEKGWQRKGAFFQNPTASLYVSAGKGGSGGWGAGLEGASAPQQVPRWQNFHTRPTPSLQLRGSGRPI